MGKSVRDFKTKLIDENNIKAPEGKFIVVTLIDSEAYQIEEPLPNLFEAKKLYCDYPGRFVNIFNDHVVPSFFP